MDRLFNQDTLIYIPKFLESQCFAFKFKDIVRLNQKHENIMYESNKIAERIRQAAKEKGVSVSAVLKKTGLSKNAVSTMANGSMAAADSLAKIADALDCSVDYLLGRSDVQTLNPTGLSDEALSLAEAFDRADERSRAMVRLALEPFSACGASAKAM